MREHLEDNFPGVTAEEHPGADYLYRAKVRRVDVAERIAAMVMDSRIDSHFKDVMIRTAAKPKTGSLSNVMYAIWRGAAEWQPYAPYSRVPRGQETWRSQGGQKAATGQGSLFPAYSSLTGKASDYDWSRNKWSRQGTPVGEPAKDDQPLVIETGMGNLAYDDVMALSGDEFEEMWASMSPEQQQAFLDVEEAELRTIELGEDEGAQAALDRWFPSPGTAVVPAVRDWGQVEADRREADRQRQGKIRGRKGRKRNRKNRYNQQG